MEASLTGVAVAGSGEDAVEGDQSGKGTALPWLPFESLGLSGRLLRTRQPPAPRLRSPRLRPATGSATVRARSRSPQEGASMTVGFSDIITTEDELRDVLGHPAERNVQKVIPVLDEHCRAFVERSPFLLLASSRPDGHIDVSPRGDPPGFVQVLDEHTLAVPDRVGNRRADSLSNILEDPRVGLLFLIPGKRETLRVRGRARIVRDDWLRERMAVRDKRPDLALAVSVDEAFMHCAKCVIRSDLWDPERWPDTAGMSSLARVLMDHAQLSCTLEELQDVIDDSYRSRLY